MSETRKGITFSKETLKKMSEAKKGKKHSKETREKMSRLKKDKKGKKHSKETREKMSSLRKGKKHSKETLKKMSEVKKGDNNHFFGLSHTMKIKNIISKKNSKKVFEFKDGDKINEWDSLSKCALDNNINIGYLSKCITNNKKCKKRYFKYEKVGTN